MQIYIDGSCRPTSKFGGYGVIIHDGNGNKEIITGTQADTTNNIMEMKALAVALKHIQENEFDKKYEIEIFCDSEYVVLGVTSWWKKWSMNGFKTSSGQPVKNLELWKHLMKLCNEVTCKLTWVKGHASNDNHNEVDKLVFDLTANHGNTPQN